MANSLTQLKQNLQEIQEISQRHLAKSPNFVKQLEILATALTQQKLSLHIVSQNIILSQALFDLLNSQTNITSVYNLTTDLLPENWQTLSETSVNYLKLCYGNTDICTLYQLDSLENKVIGRNPQCDIFLDPQIYQGISWHHATLQQVPNTQNNNCWQICDLNSSNGTFVNGKKIRYSQILQPGDRLTLAKDKPDENIANFIFDVKYTQQNLEVQEQDFFYHDILILVINSPEKLTKQEELLINNLKINHFLKLFVIVDLPKEEENLIKPNWANLYPNYELFTLFLFPYYNSSYTLQLEEYQKKQETLFLETLSNLNLDNSNFLVFNNNSLKLSKILTSSKKSNKIFKKIENNWGKLIPHSKRAKFSGIIVFTKESDLLLIYFLGIFFLLSEI